MLVFLLRDLADQLMALMLTLICFRRRGRAVGFIDNHEVGAVEQEEMAIAVALEKVDAGDLYGIITVDGIRPRLLALQLSKVPERMTTASRLNFSESSLCHCSQSAGGQSTQRR